MPGPGRLSKQTLDRILDIYDATRHLHPLNQDAAKPSWPSVSIAGGGDPMLHRDAIAFIRHIVNRGYSVHLITNAAALSPSRTDDLLTTGISSISCSFWGIRKEEYEAAMRLPYQRTLDRVEYLAAQAARAGVPLGVSWVRVPQVTSTVTEIAEFWSQRDIEVDISDNYMWNRAGLNPLPLDPAASRILTTPDPRRRIWCADLYMSDTWTWDGRLLMCCCNYFTSSPVQLGDVESARAADIAASKHRLMTERPLPAMCQACRQPRSLQATWLGEPWRAHVSKAEWDEFTYADG